MCERAFVSRKMRRSKRGLLDLRKKSTTENDTVEGPLQLGRGENATSFILFASCSPAQLSVCAVKALQHVPQPLLALSTLLLHHHGAICLLWQNVIPHRAIKAGTRRTISQEGPQAEHLKSRRLFHLLRILLLGSARLPEAIWAP